MTLIPWSFSRVKFSLELYTRGECISRLAPGLPGFFFFFLLAYAHIQKAHTDSVYNGRNGVKERREVERGEIKRQGEREGGVGTDRQTDRPTNIDLD